MQWDNCFRKVFCVNLGRRKDRWQRFKAGLPGDWPFAPVARVSAVDGKRVPVPDWWTAGPGAWGCYRTHLRIIENCINGGVESVLILEDDALFCPDFTRRVKDFLRRVPKDWGMLYLGGQHLFINKSPPKEIVPGVFQPYNVNRTHAFALRGKMLRVVYKHLLRKDWMQGQHIDHHLGRLHQRREHPIYCPGEWLVGQAEGQSNISGRNPGDRFWPPAESIASTDPATRPFLAVIGLHSSGSSALAGVLYHLGCHLGNKLGGYYGNDPEGSCGFEAVGLAELCERAIPFPTVDYARKRGQIWSALRGWINEKRREAAKAGTIAAGKYPQLCRMGNQLVSICGEHLYLLHIDRPLEESIESLARRTKKSREEAAAHQKWLEEGKRQLLARVPKERQLTVAYADLVSSPEKEARRVAEFLSRIGYQSEETRIKKAAGYINPSKRHVALEPV